VPGYPAWVWRLKPGGDMALSGELHARLRHCELQRHRLGGRALPCHFLQMQLGPVDWRKDFSLDVERSCACAAIGRAAKMTASRTMRMR
jgi:hypothetical protein